MGVAGGTAPPAVLSLLDDAQRHRRRRDALHPGPWRRQRDLREFFNSLLKALLIHLGHPPPKVHDLAELQRTLVKVCPLWNWPVEDLRLLTLSAVAFRYPGESAERDEAKEALRIASGIRKLARQTLGLTKQSKRAPR